MSSDKNGTGGPPRGQDASLLDDMVTEGKAHIHLTENHRVFYNPIQQFNRDLSVTAIRAWSTLYEKSKAGRRVLGIKRSAEQMEAVDGNAAEVSAETPVVPPYITILEALSASGLRALRYGHEIPRVKSVVANDLLADAVEAINKNIDFNGLKDVVISNKADAIHYMSSGQRKFHVVDLDPYGTATPFIDGAIQSLEDDGLLLVTCTDAGVLAGSGYPEKCFALYGGHNFGNTYVSGEANHEAGLRLMLHMIATQAAKYKKAIEPLLCLSIDFYMRCFIRVTTSPQAVKRLASKTMLTYHCLGCGNKLSQFFGRCEPKLAKGKYLKLKNIKEEDMKYHSKPLEEGSKGSKGSSNSSKVSPDHFLIASGPPVGTHCHYCLSTHHLAGPMWGGPLHNHEFIDEIQSINATHDKLVYGTTERIRGMLTVARSELSTPFYFNLNSVSSLLKTPPIPINEICNGLGNLGYQMSLTHAQPNCIKTDAPWDVILLINRSWLIKCNQQELANSEQRLVALKQKIQQEGNQDNDNQMKDQHHDKEMQENDDKDLLKQLKLQSKLQQLINKIDSLKTNPAMSVNLSPTQVGHKILTRASETLPTIEVDFNSKNPASNGIRELRKLKIVRFQENPTKNWGPKSRPQ